MSSYILYILFYFLQLSVYHVLSSSLQSTHELCGQCDFHKDPSYVSQYCVDHNSTGHLFLTKSCCINTTSLHSNNIIGIDLSNCSLTSIDAVFSGFTDLRVILLQENNDLKIKTVDFKGLNHIDYLSLPEGLLCPGGNETWNSTEYTEDSVLCKDEIDLCSKESCPNDNSYCVMSEPGSAECLCKDGFHGYKCQRKGSFPTIMFTVALCSCTVAISAYLWCIQRRKVKKH